MKRDLLFKIESLNARFTQKLGQRLGGVLPLGAVLALDGELGSGKTQFVRGLALGLKVSCSKDIRSPTFTLIQEHSGPKPLCHADLYRIGIEDVGSIGLEEYWRNREWVVAIEWADKISAWLPEQRLTLQFDILSKNKRTISIYGEKSWGKILQKAI